MGGATSRTDYEWSYTDEPHATRRELILRKHPEIKQLMRVDPLFKYIVSGLVLTQLLTFYYLRNVHSLWVLLPLAYCFTGVINNALQMAVHEAVHNHAFGHSRPVANRIFGIFANLPLGFPISAGMRKYHLIHHRYQGHVDLDVDVTSPIEGAIFNTRARKLVWILVQLVFYCTRPLFINPKPPGPWDLANLVAVLTFDLLIGLTCGWHVVAYTILSTLLCMGLHPLSGRYIAEHFLLGETNRDKVISKVVDKGMIGKMTDGQLAELDTINGVFAHDGRMIIPETNSYYGSANWFLFNVGYHVEHHDFPSIPGRFLPRVRAIAPEFYDCLNYQTSYIYVIYRFIMDPALGPFSRARRNCRKNLDKLDKSINDKTN